MFSPGWRADFGKVFFGEWDLDMQLRKRSGGRDADSADA